MGAKKQRRPRNDGGLYRKTGYLVDAETGARTPYTYWQASRDVPKDKLPQGVSRKRITGSGPTKSEALRKVDLNYSSWEARQKGLETVQPTKRRHKNQLTLDEWFGVWHEGLAYTDLSDTMRKKYAALYRDHVQPHLGTRFLNEVTDENLNLLLYDRLLKPRTLPPKVPGGKERAVRPLGAAARRNVYRLLSVMFNAALRKGRIQASPLAGVKAPEPVKPDEDVQFFAVQGIGLMRDLLTEKHPDYCRMLFQFLGLRRAERLGLTWSSIRDLDGDEPVMVIKQQLARYEAMGEDEPTGWYIKPRTKGGRPREVLIPEPFLSALREHRRQWLEWQATWPEGTPPEGLSDLVFLQPNGRIITLNRDNDDWKALLAQRGLPYWRAHLNRHITATMLSEQDPPPSDATVRAILGHETDAMLFYYQQLTTKGQAKPLSRYGATFVPQGTAKPKKRGKGSQAASDS